MWKENGQDDFWVGVLHLLDPFQHVLERVNDWDFEKGAPFVDSQNLITLG